MEQREHGLITHMNHGDPIDTALIVGRRGSVDKEKLWAVDVLFPQKLEGNIDVSSVDEGYALFLEGLVRAIQPRVIFETGTHKGRSARAMAQGLMDNGFGEIWTVDMDDYGLMTSGAMYPEMKDRVHQIVGHTPEVFECKELKELQDIDFAHIDGDHTGEGMVADIQYVEDHCVDGCVVVVDNSTDEMWGEVREFLDNGKWGTVTLPTMCGADIFTVNRQVA